jgi:hypothetical protein
MSDSGKDQVFKWTPARKAAVFALAEGKTREQAAEAAEVTERSIYIWLQDPAFTEELDKLTLLVGIATRAERMRLVKRAVAQRFRDDGTVETKADVLDWLKFAQSETTGAVNDLADRIADAIASDHPAKS